MSWACKIAFQIEVLSRVKTSSFVASTEAEDQRMSRRLDVVMVPSRSPRNTNYPMQESPSQATPVAGDVITLLDLILILSENVRLIVLGPLLAGLVALGVSFLITPAYESRSVLRFQDEVNSNETVVSLLSSADLLLPLLPKAPWLEQSGSRSEALDAMRKAVRVSLNKNDGLVTLTTSAPTSIQAHDLHLAVLDKLRLDSMPRGNLLLQLQQRQTLVETNLADLNKALPSLTRQMDSSTNLSDDAARAYTSLLQQRDAVQIALQEVKKRLQPFGDEVFIQMPTMPDKTVKPKKGLIVVLTTLTSGLALLIWVFVRQAMRNAARNSQDAQRIASIRSNLARSIGFNASISRYKTTPSQSDTPKP